MVVAITGPAGSGKTTVAELFSVRNKSFVNIDVDNIKHMNSNAFTKVVNEQGEEDWSYGAWGLLGENIALLAENFIKNGHDVVINGYLEVESWNAITGRLKLDHKFVLSAATDVNIQRDLGRSKEVRMGKNAVVRGINYFKDSAYYRNFTQINSTDLTTQETVDTISRRVGLLSE